MNVFGSFTFGSLIKILVPGCIWVLAAVICDSTFAKAVAGEAIVPTFWKDNPQTVIAISVLAALFFGLISNIIAFMGLNDSLVRDPVKRSKPDLFRLYEHIRTCVREKYWPNLKTENANIRHQFMTHADPEAMILPSIDISKIVNIREQYWNYMEFQINLALSFFVLCLAWVWHLYETSSSTLTFTGSVAIIAFGYFVLTACLFICPARRNYERHIVKICGLMSGALDS